MAELSAPSSLETGVGEGGGGPEGLFTFGTGGIGCEITNVCVDDFKLCYKEFIIIKKPIKFNDSQRVEVIKNL